MISDRVFNMLEISIKAETIGFVGGFPITNSLLTSWIVLIVILVISLLGIKRLKHVPSKFQVLMEAVVENWLSLCDSVGGIKSHKFFPFITTLFLYILLSNFLGLLPGLSAFGVKGPEGKFTPIFRAPTSDLNTTLALAVVSFLYIEIEGISSLGLRGHLQKFFINPIKDKIGFFVGLLELLSEFTRIVSFSFRLFGNVFAGEVLLAIMTFLIPILVPVPFLGLELFTSFIQAFVFSMLTLVFVSMAGSAHKTEAKLTGGEIKH